MEYFRVSCAASDVLEKHILVSDYFCALCKYVFFSFMRQKPTNKLVCAGYVSKTDCKTLQRISLWTAMNTLDTVDKVSIGHSFWFAEILVLSCDLKSKKSTRVGNKMRLYQPMFRRHSESGQETSLTLKQLSLSDI